MQLNFIASAQHTKSSNSNLGDIEEMIFGSLPFASLNECTKLHQVKDSMMWSVVFKPATYDTFNTPRYVLFNRLYVTSDLFSM